MFEVNASTKVYNIRGNEKLFVGSTPMDVQEAIDNNGYIRISKIRERFVSNGDIIIDKDYSAIARPRKD